MSSRKVRLRYITGDESILYKFIDIGFMSKKEFMKIGIFGEICGGLWVNHLVYR